MNNPGRSRDILKNVGLNLLSEGKTIRIKAHGYSMYPVIRPGSILLIEPLKLKGIPVNGEIVAVRRENGLVVHRITKIIKKNGIDYYIARGDSNALEDNPVTINKIAGRIVRAETSGENNIPADIRINTKPGYFMNRLRVIGIILIRKIKGKMRLGA
jgi:signal peptidase I